MPDREVVVTGASAGIGRATVREFARHEARIALIAREPERLEARAIAIPQTLQISRRSKPRPQPKSRRTVLRPHRLRHH
jgi:short-subunit dehydrogenase